METDHKLYLLKHALEPLNFILCITSTFLQRVLSNFQIDLSVPEKWVSKKEGVKVGFIKKFV